MSAASRSGIPQSRRAGARPSAFCCALPSRSSVLIGVWSVLSIFPSTTEVARAFLASGAVLALVAGLALTTPLGNLGSGVLLAFTQPVRLGDRITVDEHTGIVEEISLSYTALATDQGRRIFVPNSTMVSTTLVNNSVDDPRQLVMVRSRYASTRPWPKRAASRPRPPRGRRTARNSRWTSKSVSSQSGRRG